MTDSAPPTDRTVRHGRVPPPAHLLTAYRDVWEGYIPTATAAYLSRFKIPQRADWSYWLQQPYLPHTATERQGWQAAITHDWFCRHLQRGRLERLSRWRSERREYPAIAAWLYCNDVEFRQAIDMQNTAEAVAIMRQVELMSRRAEEIMQREILGPLGDPGLPGENYPEAS